MKVHLSTTFGPPMDITFEGHDLPVIIGRGDQADVCLDDRWVSRVHCQLSTDGDRLFVRDLESRHGTYVNEHQVNSAEICPGDRVEVGLTTMSVEVIGATTHVKNGGT